MARSKMIFKDLDNCLRDLRDELQVCKEHGDKKGAGQVKSKLAVLEQVSAYVDSCEWLVKEEAKTKMKFIRACRYDYAMVRQEFNMTENAVKTFMKYAIARLKEKIGENTIDLIMEGKLGMATVQFNSLTGAKFSIDSLLMPDILEQIPASRFVPVLLTDCAAEIEFLFDYSLTEMQKRYDSLDKDKLAFIRYLLEKSTPRFTVEKYELLKLLSGNGEGLKAFMAKMGIQAQKSESAENLHNSDGYL